MIKIDIYENGRYKGRLRIKDKWLGIVPIEEDEIGRRLSNGYPPCARQTTALHSHDSFSFDNDRITEPSPMGSSIGNTAYDDTSNGNEVHSIQFAIL